MSPHVDVRFMRLRFPGARLKPPRYAAGSWGSGCSPRSLAATLPSTARLHVTTISERTQMVKHESNVCCLKQEADSSGISVCVRLQAHATPAESLPRGEEQRNVSYYTSSILKHHSKRHCFEWRFFSLYKRHKSVIILFMFININKAFLMEVVLK